MQGWGIFLIIVVLAVVLGGVGYILYTHYRARRLGLPPPPWNPFAKRQDTSTYRAPAPAPGGIVGWVQDKISGFRNNRTSAGAYESTSYSGTRGTSDRRGFGPLDPDEAWDARVNDEAAGYYEEQELGLQDPAHGPYGGGGYGDVGVGGIPEERGRSRSRQRELDARYDEEVHGGGQQQRSGPHLDPFGDQAEASSLRSVSPRPQLETGDKAHKKNNSSLGTNNGGADDSPTERRSMFHEEM